MTACRHRWHMQMDSYGVEGSPTWPVWNCRVCGEETTDEPGGWEGDVDADTLRDRMIDDKLTGHWESDARDDEG